MLPEPLIGLTWYCQFIIYKPILDPLTGDWEKKPIDYRNMTVSNPHDPAIWMDYNTAQNYLNTLGDDYGLGFVFTANDPFYFIDIDKCLVDDQWSPLATELCNQFEGAAIEVSKSGKGLHIIGTYSSVLPEHRCKDPFKPRLGLELYHELRFVALTGTSVVGNVLTDSTQQLYDIIPKYFPPGTDNDNDIEWNDKPVSEWSGPEDDEILIQKAMLSSSAASVFGGKASFKDLWENNVEILAKSYPSLNNTDPYDRSSADAALAQHLAFWTGKNHERIARLMWQSGLVRDKWTWHKTFLKEMTIANAVNKQKDVYNNGAKQYESVSPPPEGALHPEATLTTGHQFMGVTQMLEYFKDCVYIQDRHRVFTPDGMLLKPEQFKATYGGYEFTLTSDNSKTTKNAWEAFTDNQAIRFPKVSSICFRPKQTPGAILKDENMTLLNTYVPIQTKRKSGDISPFIELLTKMLPIERDREILLSYMAACVQYPGDKFQWCPLLQGTEGNGKTFIIRALRHAIGNRYTHLPNAKELGESGAKFTAWLQNKLFIGVEEIYVSDRREVTEALKVLITNEMIEIQGKGADQIMGDNFANFVMCTNHKDALRITIDGRRYCILFTAQQSKIDKQRDGMTGNYFPQLYNWAKTEGYEYINEFLHTYQIKEEFNPAGVCQDAPLTSSTQEAIELSLGNIEQEIMEAIDEDKPGFARGWISSIAMDALLVRLKAERKVPINRRRALLQSLGYDWHPVLYKNNGRVNNIIGAEGGKPRLFIKVGSILSNIETPGEVVRRYMMDQGYPTNLTMTGIGG